MIPVKRILATAGTLALLLPLQGCPSTPTADRQGPNGTQPDSYQDMTNVIIYRAPDQVPNIAIGCIGNFGFMTTLKASDGSSSSGAAAPSLVRFSDYDKTCRG